MAASGPVVATGGRLLAAGHQAWALLPFLHITTTTAVARLPITAWSAREPTLERDPVAEPAGIQIQQCDKRPTDFL
ncbi:hypothetical protein SNOG_14512 [Parastagonospora nodorum SN15]|uniref:Uncharacterized protein n=1 Tax=Phaeosphaeria nodorum (strain SN15 / ATCC MYA-4574 / FGSC 10173) TaxID=321614 RepID=Q0U104_PHANO|nr:hypothetical protein SNOG_14512 [Parastagonospora nodorum SN15]EAT78052.1 hypothetical protein SNOG_14512 [Parastagonospora nodorum SN15]